MTKPPSTAQIFDLIGSIYDASLDSDQWARLLDSLARRFGSDQALLAEIAPDGAWPDRLHTHNLDLSIVSRWQGSRDHVDLWLERLPEYSGGTPYVATELVPLSTLKKSAHYADILRPSGIEYSLGGILESNVRLNSFVAVFRGGSVGNYSDEQKDLFQLLVPHIRRALRINWQLRESRRAHAQLQEWIDRSPFGVLILDGKGRVLASNSSAENIASAQDGFGLRNEHVRLWSGDSQRRFDEAVRWAAASDIRIKSTALSIRRPSGRRPYRCIVCPIGSRTAEQLPSVRGTRCVAFLHDLESRQARTSGLFARLYSLTPAEERLSLALLESGSLSQVIDALNVSRNTAKSQLKQVFRKVGVKSQGELLRELAFTFSMRRT